MATVGDVVDRVFRDYLYGPDRQPVRVQLDVAIDADDTAVVLDRAMSTMESQAAQPGVLVEFGQEQMLITAVSSDTLTVIRGTNGTDAAAHAQGAIGTIAPKYGRATVFDYVCDEIVNLHPSVWRIVTETVDTTEARTTGYTEVDETYESVREAYLTYPNDFIPPESNAYVIAGTSNVEARIRHGLGSTGRALVTNEGYINLDLNVTFDAAFARPTTEADVLATLGVQTEWIRCIAAGAAAATLMGTPESDQHNFDYASQEVEAASRQPLTTLQYAARLVAMRDKWLERESRRWRKTYRKGRETWLPNNRGAI